MNESLTLLNVILGLLALGSITFWAWALSQKASNRPVLQVLPRRNVPWRGLEVVLVIGLVMLGPVIYLASNLFDFEIGGGAAKSQPITLDVLVLSSLMMMAFVAILMFILRIARRATSEDMGIGGGLTAGGIGIGTVGFIAALLPVYTILYGIALIYPVEEAEHQILRLLKDSQDPLTLAATVFAAVIAAPIVEEFLFRAFLQGWLEAKFAGSSAVLATEAEEPEAEPFVDELQAISPDDVQHKVSATDSGDRDDNPYSSPVDIADAGPENGEPETEEVEPISRHLPNPALAIPPILISSTLFAAAHLDNWPSPIPLFALAVILGTIYHRTHRLLPCIVVHMLFNSLSLAMVWLDA